jgi:hypothetical protein
VFADNSRYSLSQLAQIKFFGVDLALLMGCETRAIGAIDGGDGVTALDTLLLRRG